MHDITDRFLRRPWLICLIALGSAGLTDAWLSQVMAGLVVVVCVLVIIVQWNEEHNGA